MYECTYIKSPHFAAITNMLANTFSGSGFLVERVFFCGTEHCTIDDGQFSSGGAYFYLGELFLKMRNLKLENVVCGQL